MPNTHMHESFAMMTDVEAVAARSFHLRQIAEPLLVPVHHLHTLLGVSRSTIENLVRDPSTPLPPMLRLEGARRYMRVSDVKAWLDALADLDGGREPSKCRPHLTEAARHSAAVRSAAAAARRTADAGMTKLSKRRATPSAATAAKSSAKPKSPDEIRAAILAKRAAEGPS